MSVQPKAVFTASLRALVVFVLLEIALEWLSGSLFGVVPKEMLSRPPSGMGGVIAYYALVALGLTIVIGLYALVQPLFRSRLAAGLVVGGFVALYTLALMTQYLNLGVLPLELFVLFVVFNLIELPAALTAGILTYSAATD
jgi:hypothetical protein